MGVSSPRSLPHKLSPALMVVASLDHLIHLQICPLFYVIHITDSWPPPASPPFNLSFNYVWHKSTFIVADSVSEKSQFSFYNAAVEFSFHT